ncbi:MAG: hypothetical protein ACYC9S_05595 [Leptospirales bacterium]
MRQKNENRQKNDVLSDNTIGIDSQSGERETKFSRISGTSIRPDLTVCPGLTNWWRMTAYQSAVSLSHGKGEDDLEERVH